jgi:hypothetical protein
MHFEASSRDVVLPAVLQQFRLYLAQANHPARVAGLRCGQMLARLIAHDPRVVQSFDDHAAVVSHLLVSDEVETLFRVAASGLLHGLALQCYRLAIDGWLNR